MPQRGEVGNRPFRLPTSLGWLCLQPRGVESGVSGGHPLCVEADVRALKRGGGVREKFEGLWPEEVDRKKARGWKEERKLKACGREG